MRGRNIHLGLIKEDTEWIWMSSGEPLSFDNWADGEPSGDGDCVDPRHDKNHKWNDNVCNLHVRRSLYERRI